MKAYTVACTYCLEDSCFVDGGNCTSQEDITVLLRGMNKSPLWLIGLENLLVMCHYNYNGFHFYASHAVALTQAVAYSLNLIGCFCQHKQTKQWLFFGRRTLSFMCFLLSLHIDYLIPKT